MAKRRSDAAKKNKVEKTEAKAKSEFYQGFLPDGDGGDMAPKRIKEIDDAASKFFEARDQMAAWQETKSLAMDQLREAMASSDSSIASGTKYFVDHRGLKFGFKLDRDTKVKLEKVKETV